MKLTSIITLVVFNVVVLALADWVYSDRVWRLGYWESLGFTPKTTYYPFFYITSAVNGSTRIPGLLTIDWLQVLLVVAVIVDGSYAINMIRRRRRAAGSVEGQQAPTVTTVPTSNP